MQKSVRNAMITLVAMSAMIGVAGFIVYILYALLGGANETYSWWRGYFEGGLYRIKQEG